MKNFTSIIMLLMVCTGLMAQNGTKAALPSNALPAHVTDMQGSRQQLGSARVPQSIFCDYDAFDENYATNIGATYSRFVWSVNKNYPVDPAASFNVNWAAITFDTIVDPVTMLGYSMSTTPYVMDSIVFYANHERAAGSTTTDSIRVIVYEYTGAAGILVDAQNELTNTVIWDTIFTTTTNLTPVGQLAPFIIVPDANGLSAINGALGQGNNFTLGVEFYGDTANKFNLWAGYRDECAAACAGETSIIGLNSFYHLIMFQQGTDFSGVNPVGYDCDADGTVGTPGGCEEFYIQNWSVFPALTIDAPFNSDAKASTNVACPGDVVTLRANVTGAVDPNNVTYSWTGPGTITQPSSEETGVVLPAGNGPTSYYLEATEGATTIYDTVTINVRGISVNAGNDTTIACNDSITLAAVTSGFTTGGSVQYVWSSGDSTSTIAKAGRGTYTVTVTNSAGCTATDAITINNPTSQAANFTVRAVIEGGTDTISITSSSTQACEAYSVFFTNTSPVTSGWNWMWDFDDNGATNPNVDAQYTFTTPASGTAQFDVVLTGDSAGCIVTKTQRITVLDSSLSQCQKPIGITEVSALAQFVNIYPNPTAGSFNIDFSSINSENVNVSVMNLIGQEVYTSNFSVNDSAIKSVDLGDMNNGIYFVRIQIGNEAFTTKISLQK